MTKLAQIPIAKIKASPYNPRHEAVDIEGLAASIREVGVIEPLVLNEDKKKPGTYHVTCGSRRLAASKLAGLESVPAVIMGEIGEKGERVVSLVENLHRRDMSHIEQGEAFLALMNLGMTQLEVAEVSGVTDATISNKLALVTKLIPEAQELVHTDKMSMADGVALARLSKPEQKVAVVTWTSRRQKGVHKPHKRRVTNTETALKKALELYLNGDFAMAFAESARATRLIKDELGGRAVEAETPTPKAKPAAELPDSAAKNKVRCPHCLDGVKIRLNQTRQDALEEHGVDRPMCRPKIRELVKR